jgi:hypothetical protein
MCFWCFLYEKKGWCFRHAWVPGFNIVPETSECHSSVPKPEKRQKGRTWTTPDLKDRQKNFVPVRTEKKPKATWESQKRGSDQNVKTLELREDEELASRVIFTYSWGECESQLAMIEGRVRGEWNRRKFRQYF